MKYLYPPVRGLDFGKAGLVYVSPDSFGSNIPKYLCDLPSSIYCRPFYFHAFKFRVKFEFLGINGRQPLSNKPSL